MEKDIRSIFCRAIEISNPSDRVLFLQEQFHDNGSLKELVGDLVDAHFEAGSFLNSPIEAPNIPNKHESNGEFRSEKPGTLIGRYQLKKLVGEGGFGQVFSAEQQEPVQRMVAIKLIRPGMTSKEVLSRFQFEKQSLAMMNHPAVARMIDAGSTHDGRPYFAMELFEGLPINQFCDKNRLTLDERIHLFLEVCDGVRHAHQKGIIHRDLKPNNILVKEQNGKPNLKIIDFGIAKALNQNAYSDLVKTQHGQLMGTPLYMSPEQVSSECHGVDVRSDVYSLGVILYELLVGSTPVVVDSKKDNYRKILERIESQPIDPPSSRLIDQSVNSQLISDNRKTNLRNLSKLVSGDLEYIVMRALEKNPDRRFDSVNSFVDDINRFLSGNPILSKPPSQWYRLKKFVSRNRVAVLTSIAFVSVLVTASIFSIWQAIEAHSAKNLAVTQGNNAKRAAEKEIAARKHAEEKNRLAQGLYRFLEKTLSSPNPDKKGKDYTVWEALQKGHNELSTELPDDPRTETAILNLIARVYLGLGYNEEATRISLSAIEKAEGHYKEDEELYLEMRLILANGYLESKKLDKAGKELDFVYEKCLKHFGENHLLSIRVLHFIAQLQRKRGEILLARETFEKLVKLNQKHVPPSNTLHRSIINSFSDILFVQEEHKKALELLQGNIQQVEKELGQKHPLATTMLQNLGMLKFNLGRRKDAIADLQTAYQRQKDYLGETHPKTIITLSNVAFIIAQSDMKEGMKLLTKAYQLSKNNPNVNAESYLSICISLGAAYTVSGQYDRAIEHLNKSIEYGNKGLGPNHMIIAALTNNLAHCYSRSGKLREALARFKKTHSIYSKALGPLDPKSLKAQWETARTCLIIGIEPDMKFPELVKDHWNNIRNHYKNKPVGINTITKQLNIILTLKKYKKHSLWKQLLDEYEKDILSWNADGWKSYVKQSMHGECLFLRSLVQKNESNNEEANRLIGQAEQMLLIAYESLKTEQETIPKREVLKVLLDASGRLKKLYDSKKDVKNKEKWDKIRKNLSSHSMNGKK